jgi:hypothetical protein
MPHGRLDGDERLGIQTGGMTSDEWEKLARARATEVVHQWEAARAMQETHPEEYKAARKALYWALWPLKSRALILDGKRYKADRRTLGVIVTEAPPKKGK